MRSMRSAEVLGRPGDAAIVLTTRPPQNASNKKVRNLKDLSPESDSA